jgi:3-hydroxyisobutyrate dehydrogenase-like beta-hydroxyacid dehydrogenase
MVAGRFRRTPGLIILKDLDIIGDMARATTSPMPVTSAVTTLFRLLLTQGHETGSLGALMQLYDTKLAERTETPN